MTTSTRLVGSWLAMPLLLAIVGHAGVAHADAEDSTSSVQGVVIRSEARWTTDRALVLTHSTVQQADGSEWVVTQRGGQTAEGGLLVRGGYPLLRVGDRVNLRLKDSQDLDGEHFWTVDSLVELDRASASESPTAGPSSSLQYAATISKETQRPLYWRSGTIYVTYDAAGTESIAGTDEFAVMDQVLDNWRNSTAYCSYVEFARDPPKALEAGLDGVNLIKFRQDRWCTPATKETPEECHNPLEMAVTTTRYVTSGAREAEIVDADIELNAVNYGFSISGKGSTLGMNLQGRYCAVDLASVLTHEVGHMLGLAHNCLMPKDQPGTVDGNGRPLLSCFDPAVTAEMRAATMYGESEGCSETKKATLTQDDIDGICARMPLNRDPHDDSRASLTAPKPIIGCACAMAGGGRSETSRSGGALGLVTATSLVARARKRRRGRLRSEGAQAPTQPPTPG